MVLGILFASGSAVQAEDWGKWGRSDLGPGTFQRNTTTQRGQPDPPTGEKMSASYPNSLKTFVPPVNKVDYVKAEDVRALQEEVAAIQALIGTSPVAGKMPTGNGSSPLVWVDGGGVVTPAFDAGVFDAGTLASAFWTVEAGDVNAFNYSIVNNLMILTWDLQATAYGNITPPSGVSYLKMTIPAGKLPSVLRRGLCAIYDDAGTQTYQPAQWIVNPGSGVLRIYSTPGGDVWSSTTNAIAHTYGQAIFPIQTP